MKKLNIFPCIQDDQDTELDREGEVEPEGEEGGTSGYASDSGGGNDYHQQQQATQAWVGQRGGGHSWQPPSYRSVVKFKVQIISTTDLH